MLRAVLAGVVGLIAFASPAAATFPGSPGLIAFECSRGICAADPASDRLWALTAPREDQGTSDADARPAWSPDGHWLAYMRYHRPRLDPGPGFAEIRIMRADGSQDRPVVRDERFASLGPAWSPDGQRVAYFSRSSSELVIHDIATSQQIRHHVELADLGVSGRLTWEPVGDRLALARERRCVAHAPADCRSDSELWTLSASTGELRAVTDPHDEVSNTFSGADWSPSSGRLLASCWPAICEIDPATAASTTVRRSGSGSPAYSPSGHQIIFSPRARSVGLLAVGGLATADRHIFAAGSAPDWQPRSAAVPEPPDFKALGRATVTTSRTSSKGPYARVVIRCAPGPGRCSGLAWIAAGPRACDIYERLHPVELQGGHTRRIKLLIPDRLRPQLKANGKVKTCVRIVSGGPPPHERRVIIRR